MIDTVPASEPAFILALSQAAEQVGGTNPALTVIAFVGMLIVLVFFHELGHFLTALWMGIRVEEFGIGFPPRAMTLFEHRGIKYTLNWLPLGGFVRFGGEDNTMYGTGSLGEAPPWKKIPVMAAGPLMNLLLAVVIFAILFAVSGVPTTIGQRIGEIYPETPAAKAGFHPDDIVLSLAGESVHDSNAIRKIAQEHPAEPIQAVILRNGQQQTLTVTPGPWIQPDGTLNPMGLGFQYTAEVEHRAVNPVMALVASIASTWNVLLMMLTGLAQLLGGVFGVAEAPAGGLAGPVGIARATGEVIDQAGIAGFWNWMAVLSLNLFVLNLLPIPALDGSHIVFSLIEWLRGGKKVPPEKEALVHAIGFATLMGLIVLISVSDVINAINNVPVLGQ